MKDILIQNKYRVVCKIAVGGCGVVYTGINVDSGEEVAIKLEKKGTVYPMLTNEASVWESLSGGVGIPQMRWYGEECEFYVMISDLLGPSQEDLFEFCDRKFSLKTVLLLADQIICRIRYIHTKSFTHRDIKPANLLMGTGKLGNLVHVIDFGTSRDYRDPKTHRHKAYYDNQKPGGTAIYSSINGHLGIEQSRRDDLESLGYALTYLYRGSLPWQYLEGATEDETNKLVNEQKMNTPIEDLCQGLPSAFISYFKHIQTLGFEAQPNYSYLRKLFRDLFFRKGYQYDYMFDWTVKILNDTRQRRSASLTSQSEQSQQGQLDRGDKPAVAGTSRSSAQPTGRKVSKSAKAGSLRRIQGRKARRA